MTASLPARAVEDYEALRDQLFGIEQPGARAAGYRMLVRCGLAAWAAHGRHAVAEPPSLGLGASTATPAEHDATRALLARLIASLILTHQEMPSCQT